MKTIRTVEAATHIGQPVRLMGWLYNLRQLGGVTFIVLRDGWGTLQAVTESEADLGPLTGLALETVSRGFTRLQEDGVIDVVGRRIDILKPAELNRLAHSAEHDEPKRRGRA